MSDRATLIRLLNEIVSHQAKPSQVIELWDSKVSELESALLSRAEKAEAKVKELREELEDTKTAGLKDANLAIHLYTKNKELESSLAALREQTRWIPVEERLPEYGKAVFILTTGSVVPKIGRHSPAIPQWTTTDLMYYHDISYSMVTAWRPIDLPDEADNLYVGDSDHEHDDRIL